MTDSGRFPSRTLSLTNNPRYNKVYASSNYISIPRTLPSQHSHTHNPQQPLPNKVIGDHLHNSLGSARCSFAKCKSQRQIRDKEQIHLLMVEKKKIEIREREKESLQKWKIVRNVRKRQEKDEHRKLEEELKERRRERDAEQLFKKRVVEEERKFQHEINNEWIETLRNLRSKSTRSQSKQKSKRTNSKSGTRLHSQHPQLLNKSRETRMKSTYQSTNYDSHLIYSTLKK